MLADLKLCYQPRVTLLAHPLFSCPSHLQIEWAGHGSDGEMLAEFAGRLCYMSQANPARRTTQQYLDNIKQHAHGSVLEHANYSLLFEGVSRSLTHELVRHRAGFAYSQLSQRYVDESDTEFVVPPAYGAYPPVSWQLAMVSALRSYKLEVEALQQTYADLSDRTERRKRAREAARSVLPNATETKVVVTANARAWRHFLTMRGGAGADLEIRRLAGHVFDVLGGFDIGYAFFNDFTRTSHTSGIDVLTPGYPHV